MSATCIVLPCSHKDNDKDNDKNNDKDKDTHKVPEKPNICYIFEILVTYSFQI